MEAGQVYDAARRAWPRERVTLASIEAMCHRHGPDMVLAAIGSLSGAGERWTTAGVDAEAGRLRSLEHLDADERRVRAWDELRAQVEAERSDPETTRRIGAIRASVRGFLRGEHDGRTMLHQVDELIAAGPSRQDGQVRF